MLQYEFTIPIKQVSRDLEQQNDLALLSLCPIRKRVSLRALWAFGTLRSLFTLLAALTLISLLASLTLRTLLSTRALFPSEPCSPRSPCRPSSPCSPFSPREPCGPTGPAGPTFPSQKPNAKHITTAGYSLMSLPLQSLTHPHQIRIRMVPGLASASQGLREALPIYPRTGSYPDPLNWAVVFSRRPDTKMAPTW